MQRSQYNFAPAALAIICLAVASICTKSIARRLDGHRQRRHCESSLATSLERATHAASLVKVAYQPQQPLCDFNVALKHAEPPSEKNGKSGGTKQSKDYRRGDPDGAYQAAEIKLDQTYSIPGVSHNAMEPHATIAVWDGPRLTLYDKTQWVDNVRD
jgi:xanthine dehydrogenase YagR molybdenum-binding subunit